MTDRRVNITITFVTDDPPHVIAQHVTTAITDHIDVPFEAVTCHGFTLDEGDAEPSPTDTYADPGLIG